MIRILSSVCAQGEGQLFKDHLEPQEGAQHHNGFEILSCKARSLDDFGVLSYCKALYISRCSVLQMSVYSFAKQKTIRVRVLGFLFA
jgi:hypothetical protein